MMSPYMKIIDGEPVDIVDYIPFTTGALFSSLMDYLASHNVVSNSNAFREFMNPDKLIECYYNGDFKPEFSCWVSVPHNGDKVFQRYVYFLSQDNSKDIIFIRMMRNDLCLFLPGKQLTIRKTLKLFLSDYALDKSNLFIQINRSELVNISKIHSINKNRITLYDGSNLYITKKYMEEFIRKYYTISKR